MSEPIKETLEFLRAGGVLTARIAAAKADGTISNAEKVGIIVTSLGSVIEGLRGANKILAELKDIDPLESEQVISEMDNILRRSGHFTHRERDIAEKLLRWFCNSVIAYEEILALPPPAELVE